MFLEKYIMPKMMMDSYRDVTPELLCDLGIKLLICDIDNTLVTYDDPEPTDELRVWFRDMNDAGITVAFVSNNHEERVTKFNESLGYIAHYDSGKPKIGKILETIKSAGATVKTTALLGDQLLTDACAANRAGIYPIIVPPIKDKTNLFFKSKRLIEKPYVKKFKRLHAK
ncbi:MAG: YqeG family HAD IIIA-type phosphatase [Clostridia bacterium]|nr:YqeG family HAD IIIA-type phosphatase [Clostridia bacterium]